MKKLLILAAVFSLLLFACILEEKEKEGENKDSVISKLFWACNISNNTYYQIEAQMLAENDLCRVWAEKNSGVTEDTAQKVAYEYARNIYVKMLGTFGYDITIIDDKGKPVATIDNVQFINYLVTGNLSGGKLTILLMDIKDDYQEGVNESFVNGYFWAGNLLKNSSLKDKVSNECDMIYIDTNPGTPGSKESNETLAHEMQHLMNFAGAVIREKATDVWIDEGLSVTAEWVYRNEHSVQRLGWYVNGFKDKDGKEIKGLIEKGNNFFVWGNRGDESHYALLDDYSTVYLFFQWLGLQSSKEIYRKISASKDSDYKSVMNAFNETILAGSKKYDNWGTMLQDWLAANYLKTGGRYGYVNDADLNKLINIPYAPGGSKTINLFPGEGVYSSVKESTLIPASAGKINYAGLNGSTLTPSGSSLSSGALLTFNANTDTDGARESGTITGAAPPATSAGISSGGRSLGVKAGPFPIGAGDILRLKGKGDNFNTGSLNFKIPDAYRGIIVNE